MIFKNALRFTKKEKRNKNFKKTIILENFEIYFFSVLLQLVLISMVYLY